MHVAAKATKASARVLGVEIRSLLKGIQWLSGAIPRGGSSDCSRVLSVHIQATSLLG